MAVIINLSEIIPPEWSGWLPYLVTAIIFFTTTYLIGLTLYHVTQLVLPKVAAEYAGDFFKTMLICAYPFGHGIMRKYIGDLGFLCLLVIIMQPTIFTIQGEGNPVSMWIRFFRKKMSAVKMFSKTVVMMTSGIAGYWLGRYVLELQLQTILFGLPEAPSQPKVCKSFLNIPVYQGVLLEIVAVMYDSWFGAQKLSPNRFLDVSIKVLNTGTLVVAGFHLSGMFMHPPKAFGYSWGCEPTPRTIHILVYWVGPMIGAWLSRHLQDRLHLSWSAPNASNESSKNDRSVQKGSHYKAKKIHKE